MSRMSSPRRSDRVRIFPLWMRFVLIVTLLLSGFQITPQAETTVLAQATPCLDIGPGTYVARVCITTPGDGATLTGSVTATVTVTAVSGTMPAIDSVRLYLNRASSGSSSTLATDYANPYSLQIPTERFVDDLYRLETAVQFDDGYSNRDGDKPRVMVTLSNGVTTAPHTSGTWTPKTSGSSPLNIVAVGDGAGGLAGATAVGNLATNLNPDLFLYLGDVYNAGSYTEYVNYYRPTLGPLDSRTNPVPGNHETGSNFQGYMDYWDMDEHYYSFDSGGWHFIALDSTTQFGQTAAGTAQYNWLSQDLQANANTACTVAFFHHPRHGSGSTSGSAHMQDIWSLLATSGVDVVLTGHEHNYQRWMPMNAAGEVTADGMTQYIVGTGGHTLMGFHHSDSRVGYRVKTDGVLSLSLGEGGGSSRFITTGGTTVDESSFSCHDGEGTTTPPPPDPTAPLTLRPVADALVAADMPDSNYGKITSLRADQSPLETSYLRFDVEGLTEPASKATLRMYVRNGTQNAPSLSRSSNTTWSETGITWNNKPAIEAPFADLGAVSTGTWIEYDVTSQITGNGPVTFALTAQTTDALSVGSRESSTYEPQLIIERDGDGTTPTPTPTPTPTTTAPTPTPTPTTTSGETITLGPVADTYVSEAQPTTSFGTRNNLRADGSPVEISYLRFDVQGLSGAASQATLRLFVRDGTKDAAPLVQVSDTTWSETTMTWGTRPATGAEISDLGAVSTGTWIEYDVTSVITGNGLISFALVAESGDALSVNSRENSTDRPQLVIGQSGDTSAPTPTPTPTPTTTTPTPTPTTTAPTPTTAPTTSLALEPVADTYVSEAQPTTSFGTRSNLRADGSPQEVSYLRFDVQGLSGSATNATLRLYVRDGTKDAPVVAISSDTTWSEADTTWNTKPAHGATIADLGAVSTGTWIEYDVTSAVLGNGLITFALVPEGGDALSVNSRNASTDRPQLVIGSSDSSQLSTPEATATPSPTPSPTPTPTATTTTSISLSTSEGPSGSYPTVYGSGFAPEESVRITWERADGTELRTITATTSGTFSRGVTIPEAPAGTYDIVATGLTSGAQASAPFTVTTTSLLTQSPEATLSLSASEGPSGSYPTAYGSHFAPGESVELTWNGADGPLLRTVTATSTGAFSRGVTIPEVPAGTYEIVATGLTSGGQASAPFTVTDATIGTTSLAPSSVEEATASPTSTIVDQPSPTATEVVQPTPTATEVTATEPPVEPTPTPTPTPEPTPLPIVGGWQDDPNVPWWYVTDEDTRTVWSGYVADANEPVEFGFDLGNITPVSHLRWNPTWPLQGDMEIQLSNDGTNWYRLTTIHLDQEDPDEWGEIPVHTEARYINFLFTHPAGTGNVGTINDIEVWAEPSGTAGRIDVLPLIVPTPIPVPPTEAPVATEPTLAPEPTQAVEPVVIPTSAPIEPTQTAEPEPIQTEATNTPPADNTEAAPTEQVDPDGG